MSNSTLELIGAQLESKQAATKAAALAEYDALVRLMADDAEVSVEEVEATLAGVGGNFQSLGKDVERYRARRDAAALVEAIPDLQRASAAALQAVESLERERDAVAAQFKSRIRDAREKYTMCVGDVQKAENGKALLIRSAPPELVTKFDQARTRLTELEAERGQLDQQLLAAKRNFDGQFAPRTGIIPITDVLEGDRPRRGENTVEARARDASQKQQKAALDAAAEQKLTGDVRDKFVHEFIENARDAFRKQFTEEARAPLTAIERKLEANARLAADLQSQARDLKIQMLKI